MPGGLIQIASYGSQDLTLTGNPQITFFKIVFRRYNLIDQFLEEKLVKSSFFGWFYGRYYRIHGLDQVPISSSKG